MRRWLRLRGMSQLDLAIKAGISSRHVSFVENGRAVPSRSVVLQLAKSLEIPLREQNALLNAAGYANVFSEGRLDGLELEQAVKRFASCSTSSSPIRPGFSTGFGISAR